MRQTLRRLVLCGLALVALHYAIWPHLPPDAQRYHIYIYDYFANPNFVVNTPMLHEFLGTAMGVPDPATRGARLRVAPGFELSVYAEDIPHPRMLRSTQAGDLLVSQPRKGRVLLLERDADADGRSDGLRILLDDLHLPHGIELFEGWLYVAEADAIHRVRFDSDNGALLGELERIVELPTVNHHQFRTLRVGPDQWLYYTVGAFCNSCEASGARDQVILRSRLNGSGEEVYASGFRNVMGFDWHPASGALYANDNGADYLGDDFPPEEINRIERGGFYGFPYVHGRGEPDPKFGAGNEARERAARPAIHTFAAHSTPLGMIFPRAAAWPPEYQGAALAVLHGSWNRTRKVGYKVDSLHGFAAGEVEEREFLVGFERDENVIGRPVGISEGPDGSIYLSDDYAGAIYRITPIAAGSAASTAAASKASGVRAATRVEAGALPVSPGDLEIDPTAVARGRALFASHDCARCHAPASSAGASVPLANLAERYDVDALSEFLAVPPPAMPTPELRSIERRALASFLLSKVEG